MENGTDTIPEGSFRDGDDEVFVSLYRVEQDDLTIGTITLLLPQLSESLRGQIDEINNDLTTSLIATQNGSGTKSVTLDVSTKNRIIAVSKNGSTLLHCVEIPTAILTDGLVIPLGKLGTSAPIIATTKTISVGDNQIPYGTKLGIILGNFTGSANYTRLYNTSTGTFYGINTGGVYDAANLAADLSSALNISSAKIEYNGNNSFTITSVSGIEVSLYA